MGTLPILFCQTVSIKRAEKEQHAHFKAITHVLDEDIPGFYCGRAVGNSYIIDPENGH